MKKSRIDKLGRIVIPISYRRKFNITTETDLLMDSDDKIISILPLETICKICGKDVGEVKKIAICDECIKIVKEM